MRPAVVLFNFQEIKLRSGNKKSQQIFQKARWFILLFFFVFLWGTLVFRAADLQILPNSRLEALQKKQFETVITLQARRGVIFDRDHRELAVSLPAHSLYADPKLIQKPRLAARNLAPLLKIPYPVLLAKLTTKNRRFVWLKRFLLDGEKAKVDAWKLKGLAFVEEPKRVYPNSNLLGQTLGFVGNEGHGLEGIEAEYQEYLQGNKETVNLQRDARGRPLIVNGRIFTNRPDGASLYLTIDSDLQFALERELKMTQSLYSAESAVGVILDAQTSEVLAMASTPNFDPNIPGEAKPEYRRNRAITDVFEPGSTMKPFVMAAAIEKNLLKPSTKFFCEDGKYKIGKRIIRDDHHKFGWLTATDILAFSSNIGMAKIGEKIGDQDLRKSLADFGFGVKTGIDLPGEARGTLQPLPWRDHLLANISFGHGVSSSPIQIAAAYAAIANGGVYRKPFVVKRIESLESHFVSDTNVDAGKRILRPEVAAQLNLMLTAVTGPEGTGVLARIPGYLVAGKTGTAQKVDLVHGGYLPDSYISSFAGYVPAHKPKYVIYISIDNPQKTYYGSHVAAPVFSRLASYAVRKAGLTPIILSEANMIDRKRVKLPPSIGMARATDTRNVVEKFLKDLNVQTGVANANSDFISRQDNVVPQLKGLTLREVLRQVKVNDWKVSVQGEGVVKETTPPAGSPLPKNKRLSIVLDPE
jgi:cell division protein FtsI (penicillin-binding protein 3)